MSAWTIMAAVVNSATIYLDHGNVGMLTNSLTYLFPPHNQLFSF